MPSRLESFTDAELELLWVAFTLGDGIRHLHPADDEYPLALELYDEATRRDLTGDGTVWDPRGPE